MVTAAEEYVSHPPKWAQSIRTDNIEFLCEDAARSTFPDCYFDAVFLFGVLHHIRGWKKVISEVYRMLKEGGVFSFSEETSLPDFLFRFGERGLDAGYKFLGGTPISEGKLKTTLEKSGFFHSTLRRVLVHVLRERNKGGHQSFLVIPLR